MGATSAKVRFTRARVQKARSVFSNSSSYLGRSAWILVSVMRHRRTYTDIDTVVNIAMQRTLRCHFEPLQIESLKVVDHVDDDNSVSVETIPNSK